jgi:hypothetical protein
MREALLKYAWGLLQDRGGLILCLRRLRRDAGSAHNRRLAEVVKVESAHSGPTSFSRHSGRRIVEIFWKFEYGGLTTLSQVG